MLTVISIGLIVFGAINCFYGLRSFQILLALWGFVLGGFVIGNIITDGSLIGIIVGGAVGAVAIFVLYYGSIALVGAIFGFLLFTALLSFLGIGGIIAIIFGLFGAFIGAAVAILLNILLILIATAFGGALAIVFGLSTLFNPSVFDELSPQVVESLSTVYIILWLGLGILGLLVQTLGFKGLQREYNAIRERIDKQLKAKQETLPDEAQSIPIGQRLGIIFGVIKDQVISLGTRAYQAIEKQIKEAQAKRKAEAQAPPADTVSTANQDISQ